MPLGLGITLTILEGGLSYHGNLGIPLEGALGLGVLTVRDWLVETGKACLAGVGSLCLQEVESVSGGDLSTSQTVVQTCGAECCPQRIAFVYMYQSGKKVMNGGKKKVMNGEGDSGSSSSRHCWRLELSQWTGRPVRPQLPQRCR